MTPLKRAIERIRSIFGVVDEGSGTEERVVGVEYILSGSTSGEGVRDAGAIVSRMLIKRLRI